MKSVITALILGLVVANSNLVNAAPKRVAQKSHAAKQKRATNVAKTAKAKKAKAAVGEGLKTSVNFDDAVLHGQYQTPDEALAKVENEKGFGDLVGVRQHFKDRLERASEQE